MGENGDPLTMFSWYNVKQKFSEYFDVVIFQSRRFNGLFTAQSISTKTLLH